PAAGHRHPRRAGQHRRRAGGGAAHDHRRVPGRHLVAGLGRGGVLRGAGAGAGVPPGRPVRPEHGEGPVTESPAKRLAAAWRPAGALVVLVIFAVFPLVFTNATVTNIAVDTLIFAVAAVAWNIFSGYSGYISLGQAVFFGAGAYTVGIAARAWHVTGDGVFVLLLLAAAVAAVLAVPLGLIALRVRRHTFVVVTIAYFFIAQLTVTNLSVTGGSSGILAPSPNWAPATFNNPFYYIALALLVVTTGLSWLIRRS